MTRDRRGRHLENRYTGDAPYASIEVTRVDAEIEGFKVRCFELRAKRS